MTFNFFTLKKIFMMVSFINIFVMNSWSTSNKYIFHKPEDLPSISNLPNPFLMHDGSKVKTIEDWNQQRHYIKHLLMHWQYGYRAPSPYNSKGREISSTLVFDGKAIKKEFEISCGPITGEEIKFNVGLFIPIGKGPFPVIIKNDRDIFNIPVTEEGINRGYIMLDYNRHQLDQDKPNSVGPAQKAYPNYDWGTLMVWAWGTSRVIDWLETVQVADIDKIVVTGQSRGGKAALLAGAYDERIAICAPSGSMEGGATSWKYRGSKGKHVKTIKFWYYNRKRQYWLSPRFGEFADKEVKLPFDQHFLKGLVARAVQILI